MNGIFHDDAERDKAILDLLNNSKLILEKLTMLQDGLQNHEERLRQIEKLANLYNCIEDHEGRIRRMESTLSQHSVWIWILSSGVIGLLAGIYSKVQLFPK